MSAADLDISAAEFDFDAFFLLVGEKLKVEIVEVDEDIANCCGAGDSGALVEVDEGAHKLLTAELFGAEKYLLLHSNNDGEKIAEIDEGGEVDESRSDALLLLLLLTLSASNLARSGAIETGGATVEDVDDNSNSDFVDVEDVAEVGSAAVEDADDSFAASKYLTSKYLDAND